jgi:hypothetical protein
MPQGLASAGSVAWSVIVDGSLIALNKLHLRPGNWAASMPASDIRFARKVIVQHRAVLAFVKQAGMAA